MNLKSIFYFFFMFASINAQSYTLNDKATLLERYHTSTEQERKIADSLAKNAQEKMTNHDYAKGDGGLTKLWCEAAMFSPTAENLTQCAIFKYDAICHMTNPQPSKEVVQFNTSKQSLTLLQAALEIAKFETDMTNYSSTISKLKEKITFFQAVTIQHPPTLNCN